MDNGWNDHFVSSLNPPQAAKKYITRCIGKVKLRRDENFFTFFYAAHLVLGFHIFHSQTENTTMQVISVGTLTKMLMKWSTPIPLPPSQNSDHCPPLNISLSRAHASSVIPAMYEWVSSNVGPWCRSCRINFVFSRRRIYMDAGWKARLRVYWKDQM